VVQVSNDHAILRPDRDPEPLERQRAYAAELARRSPGSAMTVIVVGGDRGGDAPNGPPLSVIRVPGRQVGQVLVHGVLGEVERRRPIDVITTQRVTNEAWTVLRFAAKRGIPVVGQLHFDPFEDRAWPRGALGSLRRALAFRLVNRFAALRVDAERIRFGLVALGVPLPVAVLPVPVSLTGIVARSAANGKHPVVLYVGRMARQKNLEAWADVAGMVGRHVPAARFLLVGDGPLRGTVTRALDRAGLAGRYEMPGWVPNADLGEVYRSADVLLLTSDYEGSPRVVMEAGLHGLPVVAPRLSGVEDVVEHGETGYLHASGDLAGMAESVTRLLRDPELGLSCGRRAAARLAGRFERDRIAAAWVDLLIASARRARRHEGA
jgi:glycosyltransferase involved in cell wall biosynthesis